jgi:hypothetical protein
MQDVLNSIDEAYNNRISLLGNTYVGETSTGFVIQMFLNDQYEILSAFPWYEPKFP